MHEKTGTVDNVPQKADLISEIKKQRNSETEKSSNHSSPPVPIEEDSTSAAAGSSNIVAVSVEKASPLSAAGEKKEEASSSGGSEGEVGGTAEERESANSSKNDNCSNNKEVSRTEMEIEKEDTVVVDTSGNGAAAAMAIDQDEDVVMEESEDGGNLGLAEKPHQKDAESEKQGNGTDIPSAEANKSKEKANGTTSENKNDENVQKDGDKTKIPQPPPPVMKGTLSIDLNQQRRHLIRGMWNYENSNTFPPQRFELIRNLAPDEDEKKLPVDGEFHGSFSLAYVHTTSKGKQKERSKVIPETGVKIKFTAIDGGKGEYNVDGTGTNQFGVFHINGKATPSEDPADPTMNIVLRKRYEPGPPVVVADTSKTNTSSTAADSFNAGPLPEPYPSFPKGVVALRGNMFKEDLSNDLASGLGSTEMVHRITGLWAANLDQVLADPENVRGVCNRFEYEHKSNGGNSTGSQFPVSGRYSGWFDLSGEDGSRTRINERDVMLKFRKNNAGYHNVEGRGSNVFGKYTITGSLTKDNVITIFRHFQPRKLKKVATVAGENDPVPTAAPSSGGTAAPRRPSLMSPVDPKLKLDDVKIPGSDGNADDEPFEPIIPPQSGTYSAVSRGVLRVNEDGSHSCQGKWAVTREHFTNGVTSSFTFRLEPHFAVEAAEAITDGKVKFPLDSAMYKGSFQLKKQGSRYQTIVDQQIVMKFRKNKSGAYNVHGTGVNAIGEFNLLGTLVTTGKGTGGQVELYRMYPPEKLAAPPAAAKQGPSASLKEPTAPISVLPGPAPAMAPPPATQRRESSRNIKLPSRLEEDDPDAQLSRTLEKCSQILKFIREKDVELGAFFSEPVDPVALGIPTYFQIVKEPMDLRTIFRRMEANQIPTPEEFARLVRLVFENAMRFNIDPAHSVHQAARSLLTMFNQKFRDVDRTVQSIRRTHGIDVDGDSKKKGKEAKKKKEIKSIRQIRLEEADAMTAANASSIAAVLAAAPSIQSSTVSRTEFNMLLHVFQQLQSQVVQTHRLLAELSPNDSVDSKPPSTAASTATSHAAPKSTAPAPAPEKKKTAAKRKSESMSKNEEVVVVPDDSAPLSLEEQELLTDTINELPEENLGAIIQIIREAAPVGADEDEIDLEIDQLDTRTQRKLLRHIQKFVKKSKKQTKKKPKAQKKPEKTSPPAKKPKSEPKHAPKPNPKPAAADAFFAFGDNDGSDSDSDDDDDMPSQAGPIGGKSFTAKTASNDFKLSSEGLDALHDDNADDLNDVAANWNFTKPDTEKKDDEDEDDDDDWGAAARQQAAVAKARDADRRAREEKKKLEAEQASKERLADAAARGEELKKKRADEEAREAILREQQEREAEEERQRAKEEAKAQLESVEQTVDLDAQRDIMKKYDFADKDLGGASPSSDFGF